MKKSCKQPVAVEVFQSRICGGHSSALQSFHPSRREPALDASQPVQACGPEVLNQGGLFSLSSISPQNSQLQPVEPIDVPGAAASGTETARSDDSDKAEEGGDGRRDSRERGGV
eukprot:s312_g39.t1